jgi:hypothetical protein
MWVKRTLVFLVQHWKSISRVNDILVFVVNTWVINRLCKCEGLLVNDSEFINPSKVKRLKHQRPRFSVVYFRSPYYQEGLLDEKLGWNQIIHSLTPLCNMVERTLQKSCYWGFSGRRLWASEPETDQRLWPWARDSGQRIRPPKIGFSPEWCRPLLPLRSLWKDSPETPRFLRQGAGDSGPYRPETPESKVRRLRV